MELTFRKGREKPSKLQRQVQTNDINHKKKKNNTGDLAESARGYSIRGDGAELTEEVWTAQDSKTKSGVHALQTQTSVSAGAARLTHLQSNPAVGRVSLHTRRDLQVLEENGRCGYHLPSTPQGSQQVRQTNKKSGSGWNWTEITVFPSRLRAGSFSLCLAQQTPFSQPAPKARHLLTASAS